MRLYLALLVLAFFASLSFANPYFISVNGSDATGGYEPNLGNWTGYSRFIFTTGPLNHITKSQNIVSGTAYQGATSYQETVAISGVLAPIVFVAENGMSFGNFYMPINESFSWNFTAAVLYNGSSEPANSLGARYNQVAMCINFNVTNSTLVRGIIFHYCKYINVSNTGVASPPISTLANSSTDIFYPYDEKNATIGTWYILNRTNLTADFNEVMGALWNVSNITATQVVNATGISSTNNRSFINIFDAINITGFPINHKPLVNLSAPISLSSFYNNETILFNFSIISPYNFPLSNATLIFLVGPQQTDSVFNQTALVNSPLTNTISWNTKDNATGVYLWNIHACDIYDSCGDNETAIFFLIIDNNPPLVNITSFASNVTEGNITFNFSSIEIDKQQFANATLYIWKIIIGNGSNSTIINKTVLNQTIVLHGPLMNNITTYVYGGYYLFDVYVCDNFGYCAFNNSFISGGSVISPNSLFVTPLPKTPDIEEDLMFVILMGVAGAFIIIAERNKRKKEPMERLNAAGRQ